MSAPTPSEPVGDWAAWSAAMHARLHPARPADPTPDELQRYAALRGVFIAEAQAEVVTLKADLAACRQLNVDLQRDTLRVFNELRADANALRSRMALTEDERKAVESVTQWVDMGEHLHDYQVRHLLAIIARLTRDGGGR